MPHQDSAPAAEPNDPASTGKHTVSSPPARRRRLSLGRALLAAATVALCAIFSALGLVNMATASVTSTGLTADISAACYPDGSAARVSWTVSGTGNYQYFRNGTMLQSGAAPSGGHSDLPLGATWDYQVTDSDTGTVVASASFNGATVCGGSTSTSNTSTADTSTADSSSSDSSSSDSSTSDTSTADTSSDDTNTSTSSSDDTSTSTADSSSSDSSSSETASSTPCPTSDTSTTADTSSSSSATSETTKTSPTSGTSSSSSSSSSTASVSTPVSTPAASTPAVSTPAASTPATVAASSVASSGATVAVIVVAPAAGDQAQPPEESADHSTNTSSHKYPTGDHAGLTGGDFAGVYWALAVMFALLAGYVMLGGNLPQFVTRLIRRRTAVTGGAHRI